MNFYCILCGRLTDENDRQVHHIIPRREIVEALNLNINPDLYRVPLCKECHLKVCSEWDKVLTAINRLKGSHDEWFSQWFEERNWQLISLMKLDHLVDHDEENCQECNRPMQDLWIRQLIENGVDLGKRHTTRYKLMINLKRKGFSDEEIREKILIFNRNCNPPEQEKTVEDHVRNTLKRL